MGFKDWAPPCRRGARVADRYPCHAGVTPREVVGEEGEEHADEQAEHPGHVQLFIFIRRNL